MKVSSFLSEDSGEILLCLGEFDSVHIGHREIIKTARQSLKQGQSLALLTFKNDASKITNKTSGLVYTLEERLLIFEKLGIDEVIYINFDKDFASITPEAFLNEILSKRKVKGMFCGSDYKFGKGAKGDISFLKKVCSINEIPLFICDFLLDENGNKVSSGSIKQKLIDGEVESANKLLGENFFLSGVVVEGRKVGRKLGFPTANLILPNSKVRFKSGVYACSVNLSGKTYRAITNFGTQPTFNEKNEVIECYIHGFNGDLYGKTLTIRFDSYIRDIVKFNTVEQLIQQLNDDLKVIL